MQDKKSLLFANDTCHIYNRAIGNELLFVNDDNYRFFLEKYKHYIFPVVDTYCYCLLPNHFHFLLRIKDRTYLIRLFEYTASNKPCQDSQSPKELDDILLANYISHQFSHLFNSYTQAFNKQQNRKGGLFMSPFKRKKINDENYLKKLVHYIHYNPVVAGLCSKPEGWRYSSYNSILELKAPQNPAGIELKKDEVIDWFNDIDNFVYCHYFHPVETGIEKINF